VWLKSVKRTGKKVEGDSNRGGGDQREKKREKKQGRFRTKFYILIQHKPRRKRGRE